MEGQKDGVPSRGRRVELLDNLKEKREEAKFTEQVQHLLVGRTLNNDDNKIITP